MLGSLALNVGCTPLSEVPVETHDIASISPSDQAACDPLSGLTPRLSRRRHAIYGGARPEPEDPVVRSTVGLFSKSDPDGEFAYIDGSATLISPTVAVGAAHTCELFQPMFAMVGVKVPYETEMTFEERYVADPLGSIALVDRCEMHPDFDESHDRPNDLALFYLSHPPLGSAPAAILDPTDPLPKYITIAGYGAHEGQFDRWWEDVEPFDLRRVDSFISAHYPSRGLFKDGPNQGRGSCQGDSGGPIYIRLPALKEGALLEEEQTDSRAGDRDEDQRITQAQEAILLGSVVMGPECDVGIGFNTEIRQYLDWIKEQPEVEVRLVSWVDDKGDQESEVLRCPE